MHCVTRVLSTAFVAFFIATATPATAQSESGLDPHEQCRSLCLQFYAADVEERSLCESGCSDAKDCSERCATRFPDDLDQRSRCAARCARRRGD